MASENPVFKQNNTTQQQLLDFNAQPLAPYTVIDSICDFDGNADTDGKRGIELISTLIGKKVEDSVDKLKSSISLVVYDSSQESYADRFKSLSVVTGQTGLNSISVFTNNGDFRPILFDSSTCITGTFNSSNTENSIKYSLNLTYNTNHFSISNNTLNLKVDSSIGTITTGGTITVPGGQASGILCKDGSDNLKYIGTPGQNTVSYNLALICSPSGELTWGAAGSVLRTISDEAAHYLVATTNDVTSGNAPSELNYHQGVYIKSGKLYHTSDESLKKFVHDIDIDFDNLSLIKKGIFYWKDDKEKVYNIGITAQSVEPFYPELVTESDGIKSVEYSKLGVIALAAIDKLNKRIVELEKEVKTLKSEKQ